MKIQKKEYTVYSEPVAQPMMHMPAMENKQPSAHPAVMHYRSWVEISAAAIEKNITNIKSLMKPETKLMVMVKGDGYGHGAYEAARIAFHCGASFVGVCYLEEAVALRKQGITGPIMLFSEIHESEIPLLFTLHITPAVYTYEYAKQLSAYAEEKEQTIRVHVELETGLNRVGFAPANAAETIEKIYTMPNIDVEGMFTQFASATSEDRSYTEKQIAVFTTVAAQLAEKGIRPAMLHVSNSPGVAWYPEAEFDMVRIGASAYGFQPSAAMKYPVQLTPALSWKTRVSFVKTVKKGETVGYGNTWKADKDTVIATISAGYCDGLRRGPEHMGVVLIHDRKAPIVGRVSMNHAMVDVTGIEDVTIGDEVVIIGKQGNQEITAADAAKACGTIYGEVVAGISGSLPKVYK